MRRTTFLRVLFAAGLAVLASGGSAHAGDSWSDVGESLKEAAHDAGSAIRKDAQEMGSTIKEGAHATGRALKRGAHDTWAGDRKRYPQYRLDREVLTSR